jgi:hypothetical protein
MSIFTGLVGFDVMGLQMSDDTPEDYVCRPIRSIEFYVALHSQKACIAAERASCYFSNSYVGNPSLAATFKSLVQTFIIEV